MAAGFLGWDPANLSVDEQGLLNRAFARRFQFAYEAFWWPELTALEQRYFRPAWNAGATYAPQSEVLFLQTKQYYCCLQANTNQPPTDANGIPNLAYWATSQPSYGSLPNYCTVYPYGNTAAAGTYSNTVTYPQGSQVYYPNTDTWYQLYASSSVGNLPTDLTRWGVLVPFLRNIDYNQAGATAIGDVKQLWDRNPRTLPRLANKVNFELCDQGVIALGTMPIVWLEFRTVTPSFTGAVWVGGGTYQAGTQVYFQGDYYLCMGTNVVSPPVDAGNWKIIPVPYVISKYVASGMYADVDGKTNGSKDAFPSEADEAYTVLQFEFDKIERQQQQNGQLNVS